MTEANNWPPRVPMSPPTHALSPAARALTAFRVHGPDGGTVLNDFGAG